jgi:hypothetical protein
MGRLVRKAQPSNLDQQIANLEGMRQSRIPVLPALPAEDDYLSRMVKYIPGEVIGFSMLINSILEQAMRSGGPNAAMAGLPITVIAGGALLLGLVLTPLFCWYVHKDDDAWRLNAAVSTIAFPFWAYLMGAVAFANIHDGNLAVILVLTFTVVSGLVSPRIPTPDAKAEEQAPPIELPRRLVNALDVA